MNIRISDEIESFEFLVQVRMVRQFIDMVDKVTAKIQQWEVREDRLGRV